MGRLGYEPVIQHFSHLHPLELSNLQQATCAGCKLRASGWAYACRTCGPYHLHITCAQMPQLIHHAADPNHPLALLPVTPYPEGSFHCDACGRPGDGFSYRCGECGLDLHTLCASMPLSVTHHAHPHALALGFFPPYGSKGFSCDICRGVGSNHWLYRCAACEFDTHMSCATAGAAGQPQQQLPQAGSPVVGLANRFSRGNNPVVAPLTVNRAGSSNRPGGGGLVDQAIQAFVGRGVQHVGQSLVQTVFGGGGNGGGDQGGVSSNGVLDVGSSVIGTVLGGGGLSGDSSN